MRKILFSLFLAGAMTACNAPEDPQLVDEILLRKERVLTWNFPLPRTHTGILLGNGVQGLMVWGGDNRLNITVGRAGFWDHRGSKEFLTETTYSEVKKLLQAGNEAGLRRVFNMDEQPVPGMPDRPHQIGGGRLELTFPAGWQLARGLLDLNTGTLEITLHDPENNVEVVSVRHAVQSNLAAVVLPSRLQNDTDIGIVPSWAHVKERLEPVGVQPPEIWEEQSGELQIEGFTQYLPEDDPLAIGYTRVDSRVLVASGLGEEPVARVRQQMANLNPIDKRLANIRWWSAYWDSVPNVTLPDPILQEIVDYGLYKQAICTPPHGVACSLQGPFNDEYQLPPWSNDYHFNINIQMIYLPALASNRAGHLMPMWEMLMEWLPMLRENGEVFFERQGAIMLPHAVTDEGKVVGVFWTGTIDHGCTAWMAQLAWLHYRYTMDTTILREIAWPLLNGAFEGYWAMLETVPDGHGGSRYSLPVSVSPEFKGSRMDAWGRDASFQLAALHMVSDLLPRAAKALEHEQDARWRDVSDRLPHYAVIQAPRSRIAPERTEERIALWEGMDLLESHRHHSHMAAIYPFCTIDPLDTAHHAIVDNTYDQWIRQGAGVWSGWCVPWASILHNRRGHVDAAVSWLKYWHRNFTNEGRGTLHNAAFPGISNISSPGWFNIDDIDQNREKMQLDAGFGALSAVFDLLVYHQKGFTYVVPNLPRDWNNLQFSGMVTEGAFVIGAEVRHGQTQQISIESRVGGRIRVVHGLGDRYRVGESVEEGDVYDRKMQAGEVIVLERVSMH